MRPETKAGIGFIGAFSIVMVGIILSIGVTPVRATELPHELGHVKGWKHK